MTADDARPPQDGVAIVPFGCTDHLHLKRQPIADLRGFLLGPWRLARIGRSERLGPAMRLRGSALITSSAHGLIFEEKGTMVLGAYRGEAIRRYEFRTDGPATAGVFFEDGRFFHRLDLTTGMACVRHDCDPDRYVGRYRVLGPDSWMLSWRITGPRKSDRIVSLFNRIESGRMAGSR